MLEHYLKKQLQHLSLVVPPPTSPLPSIYNTKTISGSLSVHFACVSAGTWLFFFFLDRGRYLNKITNNLQLKQVSFQCEISSI